MTLYNVHCCHHPGTEGQLWLSATTRSVCGEEDSFLMHRLPCFLDAGTVLFTFMVGVVNSHLGEVVRSWDDVAMVTSRPRSSPSPESFSSNSQLFPASLFTLFLIFQLSLLIPLCWYSGTSLRAPTLAQSWRTGYKLLDPDQLALQADSPTYNSGKEDYCDCNTFLLFINQCWNIFSQAGPSDCQRDSLSTVRFKLLI